MPEQFTLDFSAAEKPSEKKPEVSEEEKAKQLQAEEEEKARRVLAEMEERKHLKYFQQ